MIIADRSNYGKEVDAAKKVDKKLSFVQLFTFVNPNVDEIRNASKCLHMTFLSCPKESCAKFWQEQYCSRHK
jgi:hypothetical protein